MIDSLLRQPRRFGFFQAVRLLHRAQQRQNRDNAQEQGGDHSGQPDAEPALFRAEASLAFPASEIAEIRPIEGAGEPRRHLVEMVVSFLGLFGPTGVLPQHHTSRMVVMRAQSRALRDFFDLFNHRLITLFAEVWAKYRLPIAYERGARPGEDPITTALWATVGLLGEDYAGKSVRDRWVLFYAGMFAHTPRCAAGLEGMLREYFGVSVKVEQFRGRWLQLGASECSILSGPFNPRQSYAQLGETATLGDRIWDVRSCFLITVGPLEYAAFARLMPTGSELPRLSELVRLYVGRSLDFDIQLILRRDQVPSCRMAADESFQPLLGWNTWLSGDIRMTDASDTIFAGDVALQ